MFNSLSEYRRVNQQQEEKIVYRLGNDAGFFSEINNMLLAMIYSLQNALQFQLYSKNASYSNDGWLDYFYPFTKHHESHWHEILNCRSYISPLPEQIEIDNEKFFLTQHVWNSIRNTDLYNIGSSIALPFISGRLLDVASNLIKVVWNYNDTTRAGIRTHLSLINIPQMYAAIHIRRGDKKSEAQHWEIDEYFKKLSSVEIHRNLPIFLASDDYGVVVEAKRRYPDKKIFHFPLEGSNGFSMFQFSNLSPQDKYSRLVKFLAEVEMMWRSKVFIGTFSSNVGMFIGMARAGRDAYGVDYDHWINF